MSLERATASVKVSLSKIAWSLIAVPAISIVAVAAVEHLVGRSPRCSWMPAAAVTILKIDPGS